MERSCNCRNTKFAVLSIEVSVDNIVLRKHTWLGGWGGGEAEILKIENTGEWSERSKTRWVHKSQEADGFSK